MRGYEADGVLEGTSHQSSGFRKNFGRIGLAPVNLSRTSRVNVRVERRDDRIVERKRDVEEPLHCPGEGENAISIYLKVE